MSLVNPCFLNSVMFTAGLNPGAEKAGQSVSLRLTWYGLASLKRGQVAAGAVDVEFEDAPLALGMEGMLFVMKLPLVAK